ncbi:MAG: hypothetical protein AMS17_07165 [Spirochaetes bacterium DG_61]|jgi:hypothetical protein|nr:MAG: hypothetical protein AMS17_07165 [Spirochaetes bacterium DG_61]
MRVITLFLLICILFSLGSCASFKKKEAFEEGIKGQIIPVDKSGDVIQFQKRDNVLINLIPLKGGSYSEEHSITANPKPDGNFQVRLKPGAYGVEIFLEGFYVESVQITVQEGQTIDLGVVKLQRIESVSGKPIKGETGDEVTLSEGDVNIQPPTQ